MSKKKKSRLRALVGLTYPVGASVKMVREAGGIRNLSPEQRDKLRMKRVEPGDWCDDLPPNDVKAFLEGNRPKIERVKESD